MLWHVTPLASLDSLKANTHALDHELYPRILGWIAAGRVALLGNQAYLDGQALVEPVRFMHERIIKSL
jgi:phosphoribosylglycinamide formyltransferase-1